MDEDVDKCMQECQECKETKDHKINIMYHNLTLDEQKKLCDKCKKKIFTSRRESQKKNSQKLSNEVYSTIQAAVSVPTVQVYRSNSKLHRQDSEKLD
ncbi:hypothetical protein SNEBB_000407 [Seison nebaliae]|nr:hypothetical protein SNEBB_000407 [Seison nebaliae]